MIKKSLFLAGAILFSSNSYAQFREDIVIQREISPQYAEIVVAEQITRIENSELPKVSSTMGNKLLSSISPQYIKNISMQKDIDMNTLHLSGEIKGEESLKYQISRNLINSYAAHSIIQEKLNNNLAFDTIQDLNGQNLDLNKITLERFKNEYFLVYNNNEEKKTFIEGNFGTQLNVQIQALGKNHEKNARDFLRNLQIDKINNAIDSTQYTSSFADLEKTIKEKAKDTRYVKKLFGGK